MSINRELASQRPITAPPGEMTASTATLEDLRVPDSVLLQPQNVIPFLAKQYAGMKELTERPEIKALSADIPEFDYERAVLESQSVAGLSPEENEALAEWQAESFGDGTRGGSLIHAQSGEVDLEELERDMDRQLQEISRAHPEYFQNKSSGGGMSDIMEQMLVGQMIQDSEEEKKKFHEAMAMAARGGAEAVNTVIGIHHANKAMKVMGKVVEAYSMKVGMLDEVQAKLDLQSSKPGGLSQTQMIKINLESGRLMQDIGSGFQMLQKSMTDYQRITESTDSTNKQIAQVLTEIIRKFN